MKTIEYKFIDKSNWGLGEWQQEPDKVQWPDAATGLPCLAVRNPFGAWCGYVAVEEGHPYYGKDYDNPDVDIYCHGGLTYSSACWEDNREHGICHLPDSGESDKVWWLGFDCGHSGDLMPGDRLMRMMGTEYRNLAYVKRQCAKIAEQLIKACQTSS